MNLELNRLTKVYDGRPVVADVSLHVAAGECVLVCGPNGSGKSTLLRMMATLVPPSAGRLLYDGRRAAEWGPELRRRIGALLHESMLYPELTAEENIAWTARLYGLDHPRDVAVRALDDVGLGAFRHQPVARFSRGMKQRLSLARSLVADPDLVLWDEPYEGLDGRALERMERTLDDLTRRGKTVVIVAHQWERVWPWADRVVYMYGGRVLQEGERARVDVESWRRLFATAGSPSGDR